ncbi:MAG: hypothetical protein FJ278_01855 [Planctomycetes bacterium]|nr:hypothetical protein [Planctomycetota bacterium]
MRNISEGKSFFFLVVLPVVGLIFLVYLTMTTWREMAKPVEKAPPKPEAQEESPEPPPEAKPAAAQPSKKSKAVVQESAPTPAKPPEPPFQLVPKPEEPKKPAPAPEPPKDSKSGKAKAEPPGILGWMDDLKLTAPQRKQVEALVAERNKRLKVWERDHSERAVWARADISRDFNRDLERTLTKRQLERLHALQAQHRPKAKGK